MLKKQFRGSEIAKDEFYYFEKKVTPPSTFSDMQIILLKKGSTYNPCFLKIITRKRE
jgi:hypothetical protein